MKKLLLLCLLAFGCGLPATADLKIALIDTGKAFDAYYKTKAMATQVAAKEAKYAKDIQAIQAEYEDAQHDAQNLDQAAKDPSASASVRKQKDTELAHKVQDLQSMEDEIKQMIKSRKQEIDDDLMRSHQKIADEIMLVIAAYLKPQNYDLVLDKSASTAALSKLPFNSSQVVDLTPDIIARLNASEPAHK